MTITAPARPKLPVWSTAGQALRLAFAELPQLIRITWVWLIVLVTATAALNWIAWPYAEAARKAGRDGFAASYHLQTLLDLLVGASVAVAWHRLLITRSEVESAAYLRLDGVVWRYVAYALLFTLPIAAFFLLMDWQFAGGAEDVGPGILWSFLAWLVSCALYFWIGARLSMVLPAIAVGRREVTLGASWRGTEGNTWRMIWGGLLTTLPLLIAVAVVLYLLPDSSASRASAVVSNCVSEILGLLFGIASVGFLSLAFRHFFPEPANGGS